MKKDESIIPSERIERSIYIIRGRKVILDQDLAALYGAETKNLNKAVSRNKKRFPEDFIFKLTKEEWTNLKFQFGTSSSDWGGRRKLPMAFTEHGVVMAANLLKSDRAVTISVEIVRTFIRLREFFSSQKEMSKELSELKSFLLKHSNKTNREFQRVWQAIEKLTEKPKNQRQIGFSLD
ncbi:ORF6N domain-containing protein [Patescibacteria group bacterium]|nr:ORF6N domain-containing protein [Patescibacteria group bacterium]